MFEHPFRSRHLCLKFIEGKVAVVRTFDPDDNKANRLQKFYEGLPCDER